MQGKKMTGNIWIILGILALGFSAYAIPHGFNLKSPKTHTIKQ
jgi:hypothetical protein